MLSPFTHLLLFLFLLPIVATAQTYKNISLGTFFSTFDNISWSSPSGKFSFGFSPLDENHYLLAIWFNKIPEKTIVWYAIHDPAPKGSKVKLTNDGNLVLNDPKDVEIWKAKPINTNGGTTSYAAMLDNGNFVLSSSDPSIHIWESFNSPTDTILPEQVLNKGTKLSSRQTKTDYIDGRFQLRMQEDGNLVLYSVSLPTQVIYTAYWASGTWDTDSRLVFDKNGDIYIEEGSKRIRNLTEPSLSTNYHYMARLDSDGVFRKYRSPKNHLTNDGICAESWLEVEEIPKNLCIAVTGDLGSGACGFNSYCVLESNNEPSCNCPPWYSFLDPKDKRKGCKADFQLPSCELDGVEAGDLVKYEELINIDWPTSDYDLQQGVNESSCKQACLGDCFCAVAIFRNENCWKKKFPLSNGRKHESVNGTAFVKVPKDKNAELLLKNPCLRKKDQTTLIIILSVLLGNSVFLNFIFLLAIILALCCIKQKKLLNFHNGSSKLGMNLQVYTYKELETATNGFKQKLGRGAFGTVYKGVLVSNPSRFVAVKKLDKVVQEGEKEFKTEVNIIGQTHHKNLVRLLGYCDEGEHRLLVYEFMSNGSLASFLFGISRPDWNQRVQIAFGIARGLMYLHEECSTQIIHCDIKPQNILLDDCFTPRISDFGLAKLLLAEQTRVARTGVRGTIGYFAPEWFSKVSITAKIDVYSFGVMLLEIICCRSCVEFGMGDEEVALMDWVYNLFIERRLDMLVEENDEARIDMKRLERLAMVGLWCIQTDPSLRPTMKKVTQMLEGVVEVSIPPCPSPFTLF